MPDVWEGVASIFRDYGYRRLRSRARLKFLVADWGVEKFREVLENEYLGRSSSTARSRRRPVGHRDHIGVHEQKDGKFYVGLAPDRRPGLRHALVAARRPDRRVRGSRGARLTPYQKIVLIGVAGDDRRAAARPARRDRPVRPAVARGGRTRWPAPASSSASSRSSTPRTAPATWSPSSSAGFPDLDTPITVNVNGCPNACARTQVADIGLKGQLVLDDDGNQVEGFQVHLGGATGSAPTSAASCAPQGDQRGAWTTTSPTSSRRTSPTARTASRSPPGSPAPTRRPARRGELGSSHEPRARSPSTAPTAATRTCGRTRPRGRGWECRSCLRAFTVKMLGLIRPSPGSRRTA